MCQNCDKKCLIKEATDEKNIKVSNLVCQFDICEDC